MKEDRGILADRVEKDGRAAFRRHLANDVNALVLEAAQMMAG